MYTWEMFTAGLVLGLSAGVAPGPLLALVMGETLSHGLPGGLKVAASPLITDAPIIALAALLVGQTHGPLLGALSLAGAVVVALLARESFAVRELPMATAPGPDRSLAKGIVTNLLNPHPYIFWFTVGAPMLIRAWDTGPAAPAAFLAGFYLCLVGSKAVIALMTSGARSRLSHRAYAWTNRVLGAALAVFALLLARDGLRLLGLI